MEQNDSELVKVNFNVHTLDVDIEPMGGNANPPQMARATRAASSSASNSLSTIHYSFMKSGTYQPIEGEQKASTAGNGFGNIEAMLSPGKFYGFIIGIGANAPKDASITYNLGDSYTSNTSIGMKNCEIFALSETYDIDATKTNFDVSLERLVGRLVVNLGDTEMPNGIENVKIGFEYLPRWKFQTNESVASVQGYRASLEEDITFKDEAFSQYTQYLFPQTGVVVKFTTYDIDGKEIASTSVTCSIYKNRRTVISGKLFDVLNNRTFTISVDDEWGEDVNVPLG